MHKFYFLLFLFSSVLAFSQNGKVLSDKEYYSLQEKAKSYFNSNRDSSFIIANKIEESNNYLHKAFAIGIKSYVFQLKGDSIKAKEFYKTALVFLNKEKNSTEKLKIQSYLINFEGLSEWKRGNLSKALDCFERGKKISVKIDDKIQNQKFATNIGIIYSDTKQFGKAIKNTKQVLDFLDENKVLYSTGQYKSSKSTNYMQLGYYYQESYLLKKNKGKLLDSSTYFYKKALNYSDEFIINNILSQKGLGINYALKKDYQSALKVYNSVYFYAKENGLQNEMCNINYNIGFIFFSKGDFQKSLIYFKKVDSIYYNHKENIVDFINSNYYQSLIYDKLGDVDDTEIHSKIFLTEYEKNESKINKQMFDVNNKIAYNDLKDEMIKLQNKNKYKTFWSNSLKLFISLIIMVLIILLIKSFKDKKRITAKVNNLIEETKKIKSNEVIHTSEVFKRQVQISTDEEEDILKRIRLVNEKKDYLKQEFNQQYLAKKLKTNTTYLSYIFNKVYNKTFSTYYNELRLEYVINEIVNNKKYREYSTQAIAESAGFKNADSFTVSFKKKTGITPYQFINEIKKRETNN